MRATPFLQAQHVRRRLPVAAALLAFAAVFVVGAVALNRTERRLIVQKRDEVRLRIEPYANGLAIGLRRRVERVSALKAFAEQARTKAAIDHDFAVYARGLMQGATGVYALQLLDRGVVRWVYPLAGNESVLNRSMKQPRIADGRATDAPDSREHGVPDRLPTGTPSLTTPRALMQGPIGFVARQAIESRVPGAPDLAAVVIRLDSVLAVADLLRPVAKLDVVVLDREGNVIAPWRGAKLVDPVSVAVNTPDGTWSIEAAPTGGWSTAVRDALDTLRWAWLLIASMLSMVAFVVVDRQGRLSNAVLARTRDLQLANEELRREVDERERAETALRQHEEQLLHSQKMEAMGTLAGGIAHDFNNLLTAILGFGRLAEERAAALQRDAADTGLAELQSDLSQVLRAAEHAAIVTNQLLAFSRKQVVHPVALDARTVVRGVEVLLSRLLGERIRLVIATSEQPAVVLADRGQLVQVLMNFAVNARDAMPDGGELTLTVRHTVVREDQVEPVGFSGPVPPGRWVELIARDAGVGMAPEVLARAFEPFFTTKGLGKGTGLGLSTVYGIVERAGGHIAVESAPGRGTTFRVFLPEQDAHVLLDTVTSADGERAAPATVLVVEDEPAVRSIVTRVLRRRGYTVLEAESGEEALSLAAATPSRIALLLTDLVMAGMGGRALADELRRARPEVKVVFMSGYSDELHVLGKMDDMTRAFLAKPFTPDQLSALVGRMLGGERSAL